MSTLSIEKIKKLSPEQQQLLAEVELRKNAKRERLLKLAHGSKIRLGVAYALSSVFAGATTFLAFSSISSNSTKTLAYAIVLLSVAIVGVCIGLIGATNQRVEALIELMKLDYKSDDFDAS